MNRTQLEHIIRAASRISDDADIVVIGSQAIHAQDMKLPPIAYLGSRHESALYAPLARPLGATVGDLLDKPLANGGLAFSRYTASAILAVVIVACILFLPQRAGKQATRPPI
jgi:hypothetical protein